MTAFVYGADLAHSKKNDYSYVTDHFGLCETVEEAVKGRTSLHASFSYEIYKVEKHITQGLTRSFGLRQGSKCCGHKIIEKVCNAYDHPAWISKI